MLLRKKPVIKNCRLARTGIVAAVLSLGALAMGLAALPVQAQNPALRSPVPTARPAPSQSNALQDQPPAGPELTPSAAPASPLTGPALTVPAEDVPKLPLNQALIRRGDVTFRNMTMDAALFTIGETWRVNIVTGKQMEGTVNGVFKQTTLREVLDAILLANGYSYRVIGESLVIQQSADVGSGHPLFRSLTIPVQHGSVEEIVEGATLLKSASGQVKSFPRSRTIMVVDYADRVEAIAAFVSKMDAAAAEAAGGAPVQLQSRLDVAYFHTHFIPAANAQQAILSVLSPMGRVAIMQHENRLVVVDFAQNLDMVRKVLDRIDRPRPQVRITALIYDISLQDAEQLGLNWGHEGKSNAVNADGDANQSLKFETATMAPFTTGNAGGTLTVRSLSRNFDLNAVALLLQSASDSRLVANPNVTVIDNEMAEWKSVSEIPYQQITQSELGGQIGTTAFKEAGITLRVQPTIAGDGTIEMMVEPEFSRLSGFTPTEDQPILDTRKATTRVRVANKQTLVLSGLRQRSDTGEFNGIPLLKDVKYVGALFRSRDTKVRESELIVFIMPEIVCYDDPPGPREYQALETTHCRLDRIPFAEGCPPNCVDGCPSGEILPLPPIDDITPAGQQPAPIDPVAPPQTAAPFRQPYEARFRADGGTSLRADPNKAAAAKPADAKQKPSMWKRMFGS